MTHKFNNEQLEFLKQYHETIEVGMTIANFLNNWTIIDKFIELETYQTMFGEYLWDDVYDYYEDSSVYDGSLKEQLLQQLRSIWNATGGYPMMHEKTPMQDIMKKVWRGDVTIEEIHEYLGHSYAMLQNSSIVALGRKMREKSSLRTEEWIEPLEAIGRSYKANIEVMGDTRIKHFVIAGLEELDLEPARAIAQELRRQLSQVDQDIMREFEEKWDYLMENIDP